MMHHLKAAAVAASLMVATVSPAAAAPVITGGLVNVTVTDVLNNNTVTIQVPIAVAANLCDIAVNVLATQFKNGTPSCTAVASATTP